MEFKVYRRLDGGLLPLRRVVVELWKDGVLLDRTLMFGYLGLVRFEKRLARRKRRMLKLANLMSQGSGKL